MGISLSTFVRAAKLKATAGGTSLRAVLECILLGHFNSSMVNGRTVISTSEAGGWVQFEIPDGLEPGLVPELAGESRDCDRRLAAELARHGIRKEGSAREHPRAPSTWSPSTRPSPTPGRRRTSS